MTSRRRHTLNGRCNVALKVRKGYVWYFDEVGIYQKRSWEDAYNLGIANVDKVGNVYIAEFGHTGLNIPNEFAALNKLKEGETWDDFLQLAKDLQIVKEIVEESDVNTFVTKVEVVKIDRVRSTLPNRPIKFIWCEAYVYEYWYDKANFIEEHADEITQIVLQTLAKNKAFQSFGVPVSTLKCQYAKFKDEGRIRFKFVPPHTPASSYRIRKSRSKKAKLQMSSTMKDVWARRKKLGLSQNDALFYTYKVFDKEMNLLAIFDTLKELADAYGLTESATYKRIYKKRFVNGLLFTREYKDEHL